MHRHDASLPTMSRRSSGRRRRRRTDSVGFQAAFRDGQEAKRDMPNPLFNEQTLKKAPATWAPPQPGTDYIAPIDDGPVTRWRAGVMTVNGTISATAVLFALLLASAAIGWNAVDSTTDPVTGEATVSLPGLAIVGVLVGFGCAIFLAFKPHLAKVLGPIYAVAQGFAVGAISKAYDAVWDGIVLQAAGATLAVFLVMLVLYRTEIIKVTDRFRRTVIFATLGVMVLYGVSLLFSLFGATPSFLSEPSALGIGLSVVIAGIAALNLALDFDFIERGSKQGLDESFEWYAAFGLLVTIVWLYLEILRLLSKLRER
jgi:uncharacterized YccA/Bax inhibitor family protein